MAGYALRRVVLLVPTLLGISLLGFAMGNLAPGDPAAELLRRTSDRQPTPAEVRDMRHQLGTDRPLVVQYASWVGRASRGDLGISYSTRRPVVDELRDRVPHTLVLAVPAALLALALAVPLGIAAAVHHNRLVDQVLRVVCLAGAAMPNFWLALLLILLFAVRLSLVPVAGRSGPASTVLPIVTLAVTPMAVLARFTRSTMLEALGSEYILTARAKGVGRWRTVARHALRNTLVPLATAFGTNFGFLLAGIVVVETIFVWPGVGKLALDAILQRDLPMIQGFVVYAGAALALINLLIDLAYPALDPRIRSSA